MTFGQMGFETTAICGRRRLLRERGVEPILGAHTVVVSRSGVVHYETLDGAHHTLDFDFAMLLPPFGGVPLWPRIVPARTSLGNLRAMGFIMKVDADYSASPSSGGVPRTGRRPTWRWSEQTSGRPGSRSRRPTRSVGHARVERDRHRALATTHGHAVKIRQGRGVDRRA